MENASGLAAWVRLAQGAVAADDRFLENEELLSFALARSVFSATDEQIVAAKEASVSITIEEAAQTIAELDEQMRLAVMHGLLSVAIVDGELHKDEGCFIAALAGQIDIDPENLIRLLVAVMATKSQGLVKFDQRLMGLG